MFSSSDTMVGMRAIDGSSAVTSEDGQIATGQTSVFFCAANVHTGSEF